MRVWSIAAAILAAAGSAQAGSRTVLYGPAPSWVAPPPAPTGTAAPEGAAVQVLYTDTQTRIGADGDEFYTAYRMKILKPEALSIGNVSAVWNPSSDDLKVHKLRILRDGREIDILAKTKFTVLQRENSLEMSTLSGDLTATLQAPGLQVGDEVEFAATTKRRDPTLGEHSQGGMALPATEMAGAYRMRLTWPKGRNLAWRATTDLGAVKPVERGDDYVLDVEMRDLKSAIATDGAPLRYNLRRLVQFSGFADWTDVSHLMLPLYEEASVLAPSSPIKAEAARIAATTADPLARATAALALVQERIRYVFVGLDDGAYRPAAADETWKRRFGDCKGKTALLLALLRELGVPAEAVLVNSEGGDGINERLPIAAAFDHVLVRAVIGGRTYWLDGTRMGDSDLNRLPEPTFRWALPLRAGEVKLEPVAAVPPVLADGAMALTIDISRGVDKPARVSGEQIFRGDAAFGFKTGLSQLTKDDAERKLKAYWAQSYTWVDPETVAWRYDEKQNMATLTFEGEGEMEWEGDAKDGRYYYLNIVGFAAPAPMRRPREQDQTAPWLTDFPSYDRWSVTVRLPPETDGWKWGYAMEPIDALIGGVAYQRQIHMSDGVLRAVTSRRTLAPEISAEEAKLVGKQAAKFDDQVPRIYQYKAEGKEEAKSPWPAAIAKATDGSTLVGIGDYLAATGDDANAMLAYDRALAVSPGFRMAVRGKAETLRRQSGDAKALAYMDATLKQDDDPGLALKRGALLIRGGKTEQGQAAIEAVYAANADDAETLGAYSDVMFGLKRYDRALVGADAAIKLEPGKASLHRRRGAVLGELGRNTEALAEFDASLRLEPTEPVNLYGRAEALRRLGRVDEALADLDEADRMSPLQSSARGMRERLLRLSGRGAEAAALYDTQIASDTDGSAYNNRCWSLALANIELGKAEADCAEAVKRSPKASGFWDSYALVALRDGRLDEAVRRYDQALKIEAKQSSSLYGRGLTKLRKGDEAGGRGDIAAAQALNPYAGDEMAEAGLKP
ncbi:DUF3857 domain-containing protein [Caulobacter flavus]|nr:DUF3857 domain-containing protein [Caulobacter flavus]